MKKIPAEELIKETIVVINEMFYSKEEISFSNVSRKANVSRSFLYNHEELKSLINKYKMLSDDTQLEEATNLLKKENKELLERLNQYDDFFLDFYLKHNN